MSCCERNAHVLRAYPDPSQRRDLVSYPHSVRIFADVLQQLQALFDVFEIGSINYIHIICHERNTTRELMRVKGALLKDKTQGLRPNGDETEEKEEQSKAETQRHGA